MTLLDRIKIVTDYYESGDRIEILYKIGDSEDINILDGSIDDMETYTHIFKDSGEIRAVDETGQLIHVVDFKLIK